MLSSVLGDRIWPCHIKGKATTQSGGVPHWQPCQGLKFLFLFPCNTHPPLATFEHSPNPKTPTSCHLSYYLVHISNSILFSMTDRKKVCFGAINAILLFTYFARPAEYEYLKVWRHLWTRSSITHSKCVVWHLCPLWALLGLIFLTKKRCMNANLQQGRTITTIQLFPLKEVSTVCVCVYW